MKLEMNRAMLLGIAGVIGAAGCGTTPAGPMTTGAGGSGTGGTGAGGAGAGSSAGGGAATSSTSSGPGCSDGVKDGTETGKDCGGAACGACPVGQPCAVVSDCRSHVCADGVCGAGTVVDSCADATPPVYTGPLVITKGGTYTGNWRTDQTDDSAPAVRVQTQEAVILENCQVAGPGLLVSGRDGGVNLTIRNCSFHGEAPAQADLSRGRAIDAPGYRNLVVENSCFESTGSVVSTDYYSGDGTAGETLRVRFNRVRNIDGRHADGGRTAQNFVGSANYLGSGDNPRFGEIAWNEVINAPDQSATEDLINFFIAGGRADGVFKVHHNFLKGSYPSPANDPGATGSGLMIDGPDHSRSAYIEVYANHVLSTRSGGISMSCGSNNVFHDNRLINSALFPDGTPIGDWMAGISVFNAATTANYPASPLVGAMGDNLIEKNVIGWATNDGSSVPFAGRHDFSLENMPAGSAVIQNNTQLPDAPIPLQAEADEYQLFLQEAQSGGVQIGRKP